MNYKADDKVKVKPGLVVGECYGADFFVADMKALSAVTVSSVYDNCGYQVKENSYIYTDEMLDGLVEDTGITGSIVDDEAQAVREKFLKLTDKEVLSIKEAIETAGPDPDQPIIGAFNEWGGSTYTEQESAFAEKVGIPNNTTHVIHAKSFFAGWKAGEKYHGID